MNLLRNSTTAFQQMISMQSKFRYKLFLIHTLVSKQELGDVYFMNLYFSS